MAHDPDNPTHGSLSLAARFTRQWVVAQPVVAAYVFGSIRDRADAEDVLQDVATNALENFDRFDPAVGSFTGWSLGIARFTVLNHHRTRRRDRHVFSEQAMSVLADASERAAADIGPRAESLAHCMGQLTDRQSELLTLRYRENSRVAAIAQRLGLTANAVAIALHRTRQALADCIDRHMKSASPGPDRSDAADA